MNAQEVQALLDELGVDETIEGSRENYFKRVLGELQDANFRDLPSEINEGLPTAIVIERLALDTTDDLRDSKETFDAAFLCRRSADTESMSGTDLILHFFFLSVDAVLADRRAELMMLLRKDLTDEDLEIPREVDWVLELLLRVCRAFILLCRKEKGWADVRAAATEIQQLRQLQELNRARIDAAGVGSVIAEFNLAKIVDLAASYTINGSPADAITQIDRHASNVAEILELQPNPQLLHVCDLLAAGCQELIRSSVWFSTRRLGSRIRDFINALTSETSDRPVLELWPSQRAALGSNLLDPAKRAIVVEMPTSSGKTLVAEFAVIQALALNPGALVAYVVPTRALVNQITLRLRAEVGKLGYVVEAAIPVFEIDPTEDQLLRREIDVLVVTPEKLDLLVRTNHPSVQSIALVVADEAHNIGDGERGARLELLLATLKRERADTRFLLLTPFVPNGPQLASWLGDDAESTIQVSWRPSERISAAAIWRKPRKQPHELVLRTLPSIGNVDLNEEFEVVLGDAGVAGDRSKGRISESASLRLAERGGVLVLTRSRADAEERASDITGHLAPRGLSDFGELVVRYVQAELGGQHELARLLGCGVAYHHAGLSSDLRYLIELMIDRGDVQIICGTTTLAQGVNFPIASVIVESLSKYAGMGKGSAPLTFAEFWNIAGRAGRALRDRLGLIVFPAVNKDDIDKTRTFLGNEAAELASVLIGALEDLTSAAEEFNLEFVRFNRELAVFLQYLLHAMRVGGMDIGSAEIEDLLRSSLVYHQARQKNRITAERLVRLTRRYVEQLRGRSAGYLSLVDGTGFSLPSVDYLYALQRERHPEFGNVEFWQSSNLFGNDLGPLASIIDVLKDVPELTLGTGEHGPFSPDRVAGIVRDWVEGKTVVDIADRWFRDLKDPVRRRREAGHYLYSRLLGQVPWGIGAMQRMAFGGESEAVGHIPSLIFYGVSSKEAVSLRMVGVPRSAAVGLGNTLRESSDNLDTYNDLRTWVGRRSLADWESSLPDESPLTGEDCRLIWETMAGV
jgi:helicase